MKIKFVSKVIVVYLITPIVIAIVSALLVIGLAYITGQIVNGVALTYFQALLTILAFGLYGFCIGIYLLAKNRNSIISKWKDIVMQGKID